MFTRSKHLYRSVVVVLIVAILIQSMPQSALAQASVTPGTAEWYHAEVAKMHKIFQAELNRVNETLGQTIPQPGDTIPDPPVEAAQTVQLAIPKNVNGIGCSYVTLVDEDEPPQGSQNMERVQATNADKAAQGAYFYRGKTEGHQMLVGYQRWGLPDNVITFVLGAVKSSQPTYVAVSEMKPDGTPGESWKVKVLGDGAWHVFAERSNPQNLGVIVNTAPDAFNAPVVQLDAIGVIACDPSDVHLPLITSYGRAQPDLNCGDGKTGRWKIGNESNDQIAASLYLLPGTVSNHPQNGQFACWNLVQKHAQNWSTGQKLDFLDQDRAQSSSKWLVPVALASVSSIPFWGTGVAATVGESALALTTQYLVIIAPWAIVLGIGLIIMWWGWQSFIAAQTIVYLNPIKTYKYTSPSGAVHTFRSQFFADEKDLLGGTATYSLYRLENMIKDGAYESWVDATKIVSYLAVNDGSTQGFIISSQNDATHKLITAQYLFRVLDRTSDMVGQEEQDVWEETHPSGPIRPEDIAAIATAIGLALAAEVSDIINAPSNTTDRCVSEITRERVSYDIESLEWVISKEVILEMIDRLADESLSEVRYAKPLAERGHGTGAAASYLFHGFSDGLAHSSIYVCIRTVKNRGLWVYKTTVDYDRLLPYEWQQ